MKNAVFWHVGSCRYYVNRRFGGTYRLRLQGIRNPRAMNQCEQVAVYPSRMSALGGRKLTRNKRVIFYVRNDDQNVSLA
jgi:hypothetical protein